MTNCLFLRRCWGESRIWTGWLAPSSSMRSSSLCRTSRRQAREAAEVAFRNHLDIRAVPDLPPGPWPDSGVDRIGEVPVVTLHREPLPSAALFLKRLLDIGGAAFGLALVSPLMAIVALLIRLDSPGPVVYSAERTGAKGRRFRCYKFRSMVTNADHLKEDLRARNQRQGPIFKIDDDPRITRIGRIHPPLQPRRTAAALERAARGDEPGGTAASSGRRGQPLRTAPLPAPGRETRHHGPVADYGARLSVVRTQHAPRSHLHRELELCASTCASWPAQFACCSRRKEPDFVYEQHARWLTWDSDDNPLWRAAGLLLRPLHLGLAFPSMLYVGAMTVFLFRPPDLFSFYADRIAFGVLVFFVALRTMALREKIPFFAGLSLPMLGADGAGRVARAARAIRSRKSGASSPANTSSRLRCFTLRCWFPRRGATEAFRNFRPAWRSPTLCSSPLLFWWMPARSFFRASFSTKALAFIRTALAGLSAGGGQWRFA